MTRVAILLVGSLLIATGLAIAIGPARLLASLIAIPVTTVVIAAVAIRGVDNPRSAWRLRWT